ncbi:XkdF-like putative serine protease domain-containing protein [Pyramidobacter piscolens]|uniref:XkdF-like putative serine protease domain-containing protein n=1 Tax=Pyramidobacter piscolens TaxID=638849 RepID=UPI002AB0BCC5|nr:XkdF-like putative serine protease domain-containing protein [Pyramidobacter piscolens]
MAELERVVDFKKRAKAQQIVYGEVYAPNERDTDGNWMTAETIEKMAHQFMREARVQQIDKNHAGAKDKGEVVESFIVRKGDPDFTEGAWVVGVHIPDAAIWEQIEKGELTGFSIEGTGHLIEEKEDDE